MKIVSVLLLSLTSCKVPYAPPKSELCITSYIGNEPTFACNDARRDEPDYDLPYTENYICTNADDYEKIKLYCLDLRERLIKCERRKR